MEYKIVEAKTSYAGLDTVVEISYYLPSTDRFHIVTFMLDSVQQEILEKSNDRNILHKLITKNHELSKYFTYDEVKKLIKREILTQFIREHKLNELLK
jgi:hypothetical protein